MDVEELTAGVEELDRLSREEYGLSLNEIAADTSMPETDRLWRVGRLMGIVVKMPFSTPKPIGQGRSVTQARRAWPLDETALMDKEKQATPEYRILEQITRDPDLRVDFGLASRITTADTPPAEVLRAAEKMQDERGFFRCMAISSKKYLCGDPAMMASMKESAQATGTEDGPTPGAMIAVAAVLVSQVPWLAFAPQALVAGFVFVLGRIGLDGFCSWIEESVRHRDRHGEES